MQDDIINFQPHGAAGGVSKCMGAACGQQDVLVTVPQGIWSLMNTAIMQQGNGKTASKQHTCQLTALRSC